MGSPIVTLFVLAIPVACISWTVTHEELFHEPREYCIRKSKECKTILQRKLFYLFTCEYCFSHYVTIAMLLMAHFQLLFTDWRGYIVSGFSLVWIANLYMSIFGFLRVGIKKERTETELDQERINNEREL